MDAPRRTRRRTAKAVDYARRNDDVSIFGSDDEKRPTSNNNDSSTVIGGELEPDEKGASTHSRPPPTRGRRRKPTFEEEGGGAVSPTLFGTSVLPENISIRERYTFEPEYEEDGTRKIELILGRRPVGSVGMTAADKNCTTNGGDVGYDGENDSGGKRDGLTDCGKVRTQSTMRSEDQDSPKSASGQVVSHHAEYEYLVKFRGLSYLHLEWISGSDLDSMNRAARGIYRRYIKKVQLGEILDPGEYTVDPDYTEPVKVLDEKEKEEYVDLGDEELLEWEREQEKREREEENQKAKAKDLGTKLLNTEGKGGEIKSKRDCDKREETVSEPSLVPNGNEKKETDKIVSGCDETKATATVVANANDSDRGNDDNDDNDGGNDDDYDNSSTSDLNLSVCISSIQKKIDRDGPYYPTHPLSDNPYRDGYITEPPKKPRPSYLFYQCHKREKFQKEYGKGRNMADVMVLLGEAWKNLDESEQKPYVELARLEAERYRNEVSLLERAQKSMEIWQPMRRCQQVLDRLSSDSFASVFLEPVDLQAFPDYIEYIDTPLDISTVQNRLKNKKYAGTEQFARDVRKIWQNCKIYNLHGSAIWSLADFMSRRFERLYYAWVLAFRDRGLRWADPLACPWEHTCRIKGGKCGCTDEEMVLCDLCDGAYGMSCLDPPLKTVPKGIWRCPMCESSCHMSQHAFSAASEQASRRRAEMADVPKKLIKKKKYLIKWSGLGYQDCTWETAEDINDDALIEDYKKNSRSVPEEPALTWEEVENAINAVKSFPYATASSKQFSPSTNSCAAIREQLYAQIRAFQFLKFGIEVPSKLFGECGHQTMSFNRKETLQGPYAPDVVDCVFNMVSQISHEEIRPASHYGLSPPITGEYDVACPMTSMGLMMNIGSKEGLATFQSFNRFEENSLGPVEKIGLISTGDKIIAVNGFGMTKKGSSFSQTIHFLQTLRKYPDQKYVHMRFLKGMCGGTASIMLSSVGNRGLQVTKNMLQKFVMERKVSVFHWEEREKGAKEKQEVGEEARFRVKKTSKIPEEGDASDHTTNDGSSCESDDESFGDSLKLDITKVEEKIMIEGLRKRKRLSEENKQSNVKDSEKDNNKMEMKSEDPKHYLKKVIPATLEEALPSVISDKNIDATTIEIDRNYNKFVEKAENTKLLGLRLLDIDLGYTSDEGGGEEYAYYIDGVDNAFETAEQEKPDIFLSFSSSSNTPIVTAKKTTRKRNTKNGKKDYVTRAAKLVKLPIKRNEFNSLTKFAKLTAGITVTLCAPSSEDFVNYPEPCPATSAAMKAEQAKKIRLGAKQLEAPGFFFLKVEQIDPRSGKVLFIWPSVERAAAAVSISPTQIDRVLRGIYDEEAGEEVGGYRWKYADQSAAISPSVTSKDHRGKKQDIAAFRNKLYDHAIPHVYKGGHTLRDYQIDGLNWLARSWYKKHGCILADEMGLGKTVQIVTYMEHLYRVEHLFHQPFLVVVPLSTLGHWEREFKGWTNMKTCIYHDRQREWRDVMREYEWWYCDRPRNYEYLKFDVLVTTYDTLISDFDVVGSIPWSVCVVDEAHRLRNVKGKLLECMKQIALKGTVAHGFQSRILMTGTPLQNNIQELWTLLNYIEPSKFSSMDDFSESYGNMTDQKQVESLQRKIAPFMLRRVKEDVAKDIPAKEETLIDVELTSLQKQYYRAVFEHNMNFLAMGGHRATVPKLMNIQMELRKCCNHPFLLEGVEQKEMEKMQDGILSSDIDRAQQLSPDNMRKTFVESCLVGISGKMVLLDKLLPKLRQEGHKVLIFSQMVRMLDLISDFLDFRGFRHERLDGRIRGNERQKAIDRFENDPDDFVFLLSTRAGGVGINLTAADICIIFDSDWNPQNDVQAQARCHRIGQTKDVMVYRLITSKTFEQEMFERASKKLGLEQAVLGTFGQDNDEGKLDAKDMELLLKKGAYALQEGDDVEAREFCEDNIDSILANRTRTRVVEGTKTASWLKNKNAVKKSKFTGKNSAATANVDVNDPHFWQKVMPDFVTPLIMFNKLKKMVTLDDNTIRKVDYQRKYRTSKSKEDSDENNSVKDSVHRSKATIKQANKFMADLTSMMDSIFIDNKDGHLQEEEKQLCKNILLKLSLKVKLFSQEQRDRAKVMLNRLEGKRKRRCRMERDGHFGCHRNRYNIKSSLVVDVLDEECRKGNSLRKRGKWKGKQFSETTVVDDDIQHSDSEEGDQLLDIEGDFNLGSKQKTLAVSKKEVKNRRAWTSDLDPAIAADQPWPVFARNDIVKVFETLMNKLLSMDKITGRFFSEPVSEDVPGYYNVIKQPMDYGTMKENVIDGKYRSSQAVQQDFQLIISNCLKYFDTEAAIVKIAQKHSLHIPNFLNASAIENDLFIDQNGTVLEIITSSHKNISKKRNKKSIETKNKYQSNLENDSSQISTPPLKRKRGRPKKVVRREQEVDTNFNADSDSDYDDKIIFSPTYKTCTKNKDNIHDKCIYEDYGQETSNIAQQIHNHVTSEQLTKKTFSRHKILKNQKSNSLDIEDDEINEDSLSDRSSEEDTTTTELKKEVLISKEINSDQMNMAYLKERRLSLECGTFKQVRTWITSLSPLQLPTFDITESQCRKLMLMTLQKMSEYDKHDLFAKEVSEEEAPGYYEEIKNPIDFGTMCCRVTDGVYGFNKEGLVKLHNDFLLVFDNCVQYNDATSDVGEEAVRVFSYLPVVFLSCRNSV